jgi:hypothetical protein
MFNNNNQFYNNKYFGNWRFAKGFGEKIFFGAWQAAPFNQDNGSTFNGQSVPPPDPNAFDDDTATLEGSIGHWDSSWFNATVSRSATQAHSGTHSLQVNVTASGWGVQLDNFPGFQTTAGNKQLRFWAKQGSGTISNVLMRIKWFDSNQQLLQTNDVPINPLSTVWHEGTADVTAPTGTTSVFVELHSSSGSAGNTMYLDDFVIADD